MQLEMHVPHLELLIPWGVFSSYDSFKPSMRVNSVYILSFGSLYHRAGKPRFKRLQSIFIFLSLKCALTVRKCTIINKYTYLEEDVQVFYWQECKMKSPQTIYLRQQCLYEICDPQARKKENHALSKVADININQVASFVLTLGPWVFMAMRIPGRRTFRLPCRPGARAGGLRPQPASPCHGACSGHR